MGWEGFLWVTSGKEKKRERDVECVLFSPHQYKAMANQGQSFKLAADQPIWHLQNNHLQPKPLCDIMLHTLF